MTISREGVESIKQRYDVREQIARQALDVSDGDIAGAGRIIEAADEFRHLHRFSEFTDDIDQLIQQGGVSLQSAMDVLYKYNGSMGSAKAKLDAHQSNTNEAVKSFREGVKDIREKRSFSDTESSEPEATDDVHPRGTFIVPRNKHYFQKLEARSRDGQASLVETVYALTGKNYTHPTDLIPLDNDKFYFMSTQQMTSYNARAMANEVARSYSGSTSPKIIAKFHTHPGGVPSPSNADQSGAREIYQEFVSAFGTDDFEFFHGIHSLTKHGRSVSPNQRQQPQIINDRLVWEDAIFKHHVAVYGYDFQTQKPIRLDKEI